MNPIIDVLLRYVQRTAAEVSVTLLVSGQRITGFLTPTQRYERWEREVMHRASLGGGTFELPSLDTEVLSEKEVFDIQDAWPDLEQKLEEAGTGFSYLCLRDAVLHSAVPVSDRTCPLLILTTQSVDGVMVGFHADDRA